MRNKNGFRRLLALLITLLLAVQPALAAPVEDPESNSTQVDALFAEDDSSIQGELSTQGVLSIEDALSTESELSTEDSIDAAVVDSSPDNVPNAPEELKDVLLPGAAEYADSPVEDAGVLSSGDDILPPADDPLKPPSGASGDAEGRDGTVQENTDPETAPEAKSPEAGSDPLPEVADPETAPEAEGESSAKGENDGEAGQDPDALAEDTASTANDAGEADPKAVEGYQTRRFSAMAAVGRETWNNVNLVRDDGYTGKLARVNGTLVLNNVLIEGCPARSVNLFDWFDLAPGAWISCGHGAGLSISLSALSINKGSSVNLGLTWNGQPVPAKKARWASSNGRLVSVKRGKIKARAAGWAYIAASYNNQVAICRLQLTAFVYPKKITMKKKQAFALFTTGRLAVTFKPKNTTERGLTWYSSNPSVISVDAAGNLTAHSPGTVNITARTVNGKFASSTVSVVVVWPSGVGFRKPYITLYPGGSSPANAYVAPGNASYQGLSYTSSNPEVATVDPSGMVHAVSKGTAYIIARSTARTNLAGRCKVCVISPDDPPLTGLVIGLNPGHQITTIKKKYPLAPGSRKKAYGVKTGAVGKFTHQPEYEVVLQVGLKLKRILESQGATVVITRTSNNVMLTNIDRASILNNAGVDIALQLHCNSWKKSSSNGSSCYIKTTGSWVNESWSAASSIAYNMSRYTGFRNLGVKICNTYMSLNWTTTPTVLLEMGYLTNRSDDLNLANDAFREKLAYGIYVGLCQHFGRSVA